MKQKTIGFSRRYEKALRKHLEQGQPADLQPAVELGRLAVALGLETLELARIHEQVFALFKSSNKHKRMGRGAEKFFSEAIIPITETQRAAKQNKIDLNRLNVALNRRTLELAATNRQLQRGVIRRKSVEAALHKSGEHYSRLLKDSLHLQEGLRQLTHQVLTSQEDERRKISHELQDEIAQTLLGINVRLLTLKKSARGSPGKLTKEIANTQQVVVKSIQSIDQFARELDVTSKPPGPSVKFVTRLTRRKSDKRKTL